MSDRRTEEGKNAITGRLHDVAVVSMNRVDHKLKDRIDNGTSLFRIEVLHQVHRSLDVREQRCDRLALALDRGRGR